jgi:branched-chain amino acid transport system substrate-binding protein
MSPMHKLTRRAFATAAALTAAALATTLLPSTAQQAAKAPIKIGALLSLTGDLQAYGENCLKGIKLALKQINEAGGVLGSQIQVVEADDQTSAQPAIDAAKRLVNVEKVAAIVGALGSGVTIPVATTVTVPSKIPQISPASTAPTITTLDDDDFLFRTVPSDAFQGVALAQITREEQLDRLAVIYINNDYGQGLADSFKAAFEKRGARSPRPSPTSQAKLPTAASWISSRKGTPRRWWSLAIQKTARLSCGKPWKGGYLSALS